MKKILALMLAVVLTLSLGAVALRKRLGQKTRLPAAPSTMTKTLHTTWASGDLEAPGSGEPDKPGATYYYTIMDNDEETAVDGMLVSDEIAKHLTVSIKESGDSMIDSYAIVKQNGVYKVKVVTKETYLTDETEATWTITLKRNSRYTVAEATVDIVQQWAEITTVDKDGYGEYVF